MKSLQHHLAGLGQGAVIALVAVIALATGAIIYEMKAAPGASTHASAAKESSGSKDAKKKKKKKHTKSDAPASAGATEKDDEPEKK